MGVGMFGYFSILIGAYVLYSAVTGNGQLYKNEYIKKGMEKSYRKRLRQIAAGLGPAMLAQGVLELLYAQRQLPWMQTAVTVLWAVSAILIILLLILSVRMTDRSKAAATKSKKDAPAPKSAFIFDEDDEKK